MEPTCQSSSSLCFSDKNKIKQLKFTQCPTTRMLKLHICTSLHLFLPSSSLSVCKSDLNYLSKFLLCPWFTPQFKVQPPGNDITIGGGEQEARFWCGLVRGRLIFHCSFTRTSKLWQLKEAKFSYYSAALIP